MDYFLIICALGLSPFIISYIAIFIKTKGTMYSEEVVYKNGEPNHIICTHHSFIGVDHVSMEKHPDALSKAIKYYANLPNMKYICQQIDDKGSWSEKDGIPKEIREESKKYRKKHGK